MMDKKKEIRHHCNLLVKPSNLKECVDWVLRVGMCDVPSRDEDTFNRNNELATAIKKHHLVLGNNDNNIYQKEDKIEKLIFDISNELAHFVGYCQHDRDGNNHIHHDCNDLNCGVVEGCGIANRDYYDRKQQEFFKCQQCTNCKECENLEKHLQKFCSERYACMLYTLRCSQTALTGRMFNSSHNCIYNGHHEDRCQNLENPSSYLGKLAKDLDEFSKVLVECKDRNCASNCVCKSHVSEWKELCTKLKDSAERLKSENTITEKLKKYKDDRSYKPNAADATEKSKLEPFIKNLGQFLTCIGRSYSSSYGVQATWPQCSKDAKCDSCTKNNDCKCTEEDDGNCDGDCCEDCDVRTCAAIFIETLGQFHDEIRDIKHHFTLRFEETKKMNEILHSCGYDSNEICVNHGESISKSLDSLISKISILNQKAH